MNTDRIKEIQERTTAYPESRSVQQALVQVWHETVRHCENKVAGSKVIGRITPRQGHRINLSCLVEALSKFKKVPQAVGEEHWLAVETMSHRIQKKYLVVLKKRGMGMGNEVAWIQIKLVAALYDMPDGQKALTWEVA